MGVRVLYDAEARHAALYDSVTGWAFGPMFATRERAESFLTWARKRGLKDARLMSDDELINALNAWRAAGAEGRQEA